MIPILSSERLVLEPFRMADAPLVQQYAGDAQVAMTTLNVPHPYPEDAAEKWIASHLPQFLDRRNVVFSIRSLQDEVYGAINLSLCMQDQRGELGYWIGVPYWNKGICTEATARIIKYGFDELGLNKIYARHLTVNPASGRVMEKNGMKREGIQQGHVKKDGVFMDISEYGILRSNYKIG